MTLFYIAGACYPSLVGKKGIPTFQFIYFFSSFWGQFGPNCTTFLLAGRVLPLPAALFRHATPFLDVPDSAYVDTLPDGFAMTIAFALGMCMVQSI